MIILFILLINKYDIYIYIYIYIYLYYILNSLLTTKHHMFIGVI